MKKLLIVLVLTIISACRQPLPMDTIYNYVSATDVEEYKTTVISASDLGHINEYYVQLRYLKHIDTKTGLPVFSITKIRVSETEFTKFPVRSIVDYD